MELKTQMKELLSLIKSTPGEFTTYMRRLLEKWSMEGGQLQGLKERLLLPIGRKDLISGMSKNYDRSNENN